jgi:hypothetical protein
MSDLRRAAEMALETFEKIYEGCGEVKKDNLSKHSNELATLVRKDCIPQIEALRQALAEPANSTTGFVEPKASSQTEQEPVAFVTGYFGGHLTITCFDPALVLPDGLALYTAPPKPN